MLSLRSILISTTLGSINKFVYLNNEKNILFDCYAMRSFLYHQCQYGW